VSREYGARAMWREKRSVEDVRCDPKGVLGVTIIEKHQNKNGKRSERRMILGYTIKSG